MTKFLSTAGVSRIDVIKASIAEDIGNPKIRLADVAANHCISSSYVRKLFAAEGTTFTGYVLNARLEHACLLLTDTSPPAHSISAVALKCGFNDVSYFNRAFRKRYGFTPSDLRSGPRGLRIP